MIMKDNLKGQINQPLFKVGDKVVINITEPRIEGYFYFFTAMGNGSVCTVIKATQYHYNPHGSPRYKDLEKWIEDHVLEELYEDYDIDE